MRIDVLGAVRARDDHGGPVDLGGPRHREVLARLVAAEGRMVTVDTLVDDLWPEPPARALGALRTFVAALRRAVEPDRPPRTPPRVLLTEGTGYALRIPRAAVDAYRFQDALAAARRSPGSVAALGEALASWRGPAYADLPGVAWAQRERTRLEELRLQAVELRAGILLDAGQGADLVAELGAHVAEHPWREPAWGLLARALYRDGRQADALAALRRARTMLVEQFGLDPGTALQRLESDILNRSATLEAAPRTWPGTDVRLGPRTTVDLARTLALAGSDALVLSRRNRLAAVEAAERTGDVALTARVIGAYDVPAIWSRADDPEQSRAVVSAAERTLAALGPTGAPDLRARLLATVAVESRSADTHGSAARSAQRAARQAEALARDLGDPALLAFALNGVFLQSFSRPGLAPQRDGTGAELVSLATRHGLPTFAILGRLVRMQSASARGDLDTAAGHASAAEQLAAVHESPLVSVLTLWFRARVTAARSTAAGGPTAAAAAAAYRAADEALTTAGMPGLRRGLLPLALLGLRLLHDRPAPTDPQYDWGPHLPWAAPLVLLARHRPKEARAALAAAPEPPRDHLQEALWCLTAHAAARLGDHETAARAATALRGARDEDAGAASGLLTLGPVERYLTEAEACAATHGRD
ncbi:AfsR/SARP family transcriptional regulator [Streptomyces sp. G44]|uniref:AfsR/SARP family transcriptional regulator n=1 Tax=Streptomyces sp. G44 TaxID=2807632 RepID=UPI0019602CEE|nr:AfsR/SARP family transcriptional regulator [Streptomyces sp. G44]MBM7167674.1 AfsR/SARP family transcriptional regulator [Streptomyces sp. G44]